MKSKEEEKKRKKVRFILVPPMKLDYPYCVLETGTRESFRACVCCIWCSQIVLTHEQLL